MALAAVAYPVAAKVAGLVAEQIAAKYDDSQPRDENGRWTDGGGGGGSGGGGGGGASVGNGTEETSWAWGDDEERYSLRPPEVTDDVKNSITQSEKSSAMKYTQSGYNDLNERLREGSPLTSDQQKMANDLDAIIEKSGEMEKPATVWRGLHGYGQNFPEKAANNFSQHIGEEVEFPGFQSSSFFAEPALDASLSKNNSGVILEIKTRWGAQLSSLSNYDDEAELLLGRNWHYKVVSVKPGITFQKGDYGNTVKRTVIQLEVTKHGK